jgi:hypothetical protein
MFDFDGRATTMKARTSKRTRTGRGTGKVGDLKAKADRAAAVKGGIKKSGVAVSGHVKAFDGQSW